MLTSPFPFAHRTGARPGPAEYGLFLLLVGLCFFDQVLLGPYAVVGFHDTLDVELPHFLNQGRLLLEHGLFSWYPNSCGGLPAFAGQHPPYAPPTLLLTFMPLWLLNIVWSLAQSSLAGYGMFRLLRDFLKVSDAAAFLGGTFFAFTLMGGIYHIVFAYLFPIFFVWTMELAEPGRRLGGRLLRVFGLLAIAWISYPVLTLPHTPIFHLGLVLAFGLAAPNAKRHVAAVFLVWTGYVLLFVPSIYSLYEYIPFAHRDWGFVYTGLGKALWSFWDALFGRLRSHPLLPLVLFGLPLLRRSGRLRLAILFLIVPQAVSALFTSDFKALIVGSFLLKMDLYLFSTVTGVGACIFAFWAFDELRRAERRPSVAWAVAVFLLMFLLKRELPMVRNILTFGAALSALHLLRLRDAGRLTARGFGVGLAFFAACLAGAGMMIRQDFLAGGDPTAPYAKGFGNHPQLEALREAERQAPFRVGCVDVHPAVVQAHGLVTVGQKGPLFSKYYKQYVRLVVAPQLAEPRVAHWFDNWWHYLFFTRRDDAAHFFYPLTLKTKGPRAAADWSLPQLLAMNVKYLVASQPIRGIEAIADLHAVDPGRGLHIEALRDTRIDRFYTLPVWIYRLRDPFERGWLARTAVVLPTREALLDEMGRQDLAGMRAKVFLLAGDVQDLDLPAGEGGSPDEPARVVEHGPDRLVFEGTAGGPRFLVVSVNFEPNWTARVNGEPAKVLPANNAFQAVRIARAGPFRAEIEYRRPIVWRLHLATLAGNLLIVSLLLLGRGGAVPAAACRTPLPDPAVARAVAARIRPMLGWGALAVALWAAQFFLFVILKNAEPGRSLAYLWAAISTAGLLVAWWANWAARRWLAWPEADFSS
jgi:hypothetical protein